MSKLCLGSEEGVRQRWAHLMRGRVQDRTSEDGAEQDRAEQEWACMVACIRDSRLGASNGHHAWEGVVVEGI